MNTAETAQRDALGRMLPGNKIAVGHKPGGAIATAARFRALLHANTTDAEVLEVWKALREEAAAGNVFAIREFLDRLVGKTPLIQEGQDSSDLREYLLGLWRDWANPSPTKDAGPIEDAEFRVSPDGA